MEQFLVTASSNLLPCVILMNEIEKYGNILNNISQTIYWISTINKPIDTNTQSSHNRLRSLALPALTEYIKNIKNENTMKIQ